MSSPGGCRRWQITTTLSVLSGLLLAVTASTALTPVAADAARAPDAWLNISPAQVVQGAPVAVRGRVGPRVSQRIRLERRRDGAWHGVLRTRTNDHGRFSFTAQLADRRSTRRYRVRSLTSRPHVTPTARLVVGDQPPATLGGVLQISNSTRDTRSPVIAADEGSIAFVRRLPSGYQYDATIDLWDPTTRRVEHLPTGARADEPSISDDGRHVAYQGTAGLRVLDRESGDQEVVAESQVSAHTPRISGDGRWVAYDGFGVRDQGHHIFLNERGMPDSADVQVSTGGASASPPPSISGDGSLVAFAYTPEGDLGRGVSVWEDGLVRHAPVRGGGQAQVARDGRHVLFAVANSSGYGLLSWDLLTDEVVEVTDTAGDAGSISASGRYVAFTSDASDLVPGERPDRNDAPDLFRWDRRTGEIERLTYVWPRDDATDGVDDSFVSDPSISADGMQVAFTGGQGLTLRNTWQRTQIFLWSDAGR